VAENNPAFSKLRFSSGGGFGDALLDPLLKFLAAHPDPRVLDLGCGEGALALAIAQARSDATVIALDISNDNVKAARSAANASGLGDRIKTECDDYMKWSDRLFDAIVCDSVLHLIEGDDEALAERLSADLRPGGVLIASFPVASVMNTLRFVLRRIWRTLPVAIDAIALALARRFYPTFTEEALADRIKYLRIIPLRLYGQHVRSVFTRHGLDVVSELQMPNRSIVKPTHSIVIWRRV